MENFEHVVAFAVPMVAILQKKFLTVSLFYTEVTLILRLEGFQAIALPHSTPTF